MKMGMRRKDREVTNINEIEKILFQCKTCHVAMVKDGTPYVVPFMLIGARQTPKYSIRISAKNFGFENNIKSVPLYAVYCL